MNAEVCCPTCRLVQPAAEQCRTCGATTRIEISNADAAFEATVTQAWRVLSGQPPPRTRPVRNAPARIHFLAMGVVSLFIAWMMMPSWLATMWAVCGGAALVVTALTIPIVRRQHETRRKRGRAVTLAPPPKAPRHVGTVRPCDDTTPLPHGALAAALTVRDRHGVLLRDVRATAFLLERDGAPPFRVRGDIELAGAATPAADDAIHALEARLGAPASCGPRARAESIVLRDGDRVEVYAEPHLERVADGYRDGEALVAAGEPGRPVFVRRLPAGRR